MNGIKEVGCMAGHSVCLQSNLVRMVRNLKSPICIESLKNVVKLKGCAAVINMSDTFSIINQMCPKTSKMFIRLNYSNAIN